MAKKRKKRQRRPRAAPDAPKPAVSKPAVERRRAAAKDERPPAPWGSFPLVELAVFVGLVMIVVGFVVGSSRGALMIGIGIGLAALGGLELTIREHFSGYRSHSTLLAGIPAIATLGILFYAGPDSLPSGARLAIAAGVFGVCFIGFTTMFKRKAGVAFKLR